MAGLRGRLALVTGATGGIGKATSRKLAELGCDIAIHFHAAKSAAEDLAQELRGHDVRAEVFQADLTNYDEGSMRCSDLLPHC